jgi:hypothetical protein
MHAGRTRRGGQPQYREHKLTDLIGLTVIAFVAYGLWERIEKLWS